MNKILLYLAMIVAGAMICLSSMRAQEQKTKNDDTSDGRRIFAANKCMSCHSIEAIGIKEKADANESTELKPPDLSSVGLVQKAEWVMKYLQKKEKLDGEKHPKKFKGSDEELATLAKWLETLKADSTKRGKK